MLICECMGIFATTPATNMSAFPGHRKRIKKLIRSVKRGIAGHAATATMRARFFKPRKTAIYYTNNGLITPYCKRPSDLF
jgi:hypothetical protein